MLFLLQALGFEIFFDLQLQDSDIEEQIELTAKVEKSIESDSNSNELEIGAALACLLSDPPIDSESLGDNLAISMIVDQLGMNPFCSLLDASDTPSLTWKLEEGFLSSSSESGSEPESDSI